MAERINLAGKTFGRWSVVAYAGDRKWLARCECGTEAKVDGGSLRGGRSNGCEICQRSRGTRVTHGESKTRLYNIWSKMKSRCERPTDAAFHRYGGRGIKICGSWSESYESFRDWARNNGYSDELTIDRINNDGGYEPDNCRWATYSEQNRNYSRNRPIYYQGRYILIGDLAAEHNIPADIVKNRIRRYGWPVEKALTTPVQTKIKREPWVAYGLSRSTYYRRRLAGTLPISFDTIKANIDRERG